MTRHETMSANGNQSITFWFDPICPFAWVTSRWVLDAQESRDFEIEWKLMSLAALNEGRDLPKKYQHKMQTSWEAGRVIDAVVEEEGIHRLGDLYTAYGTAAHEQNKAITPEVHEVILREAGFDTKFAKEYENVARDEALRRSQREVEGLVGNDVGTPVIQVGGRGFFGPVITRLPPKQEAARLFDSFLTLIQFDSFYELKRGRAEEPQLPVLNR